MKTQRATQGRTTYLRPPLYLRIAVGEIDEHSNDVGVEYGIGNHPLMRGQVRVSRDGTGSLAPLSTYQLYEWLAWFLEVERQRRQEIPGQPRRRGKPHPDWPSPAEFPPMTTPLQGRRAED